MSRWEAEDSSGVGGDGGAEEDEAGEEVDGDDGEAWPASGSWSWSEQDGGGVVDGGGTDWARGRLERGEDGMAGGEVEGGGEVPATGAAC